jgi:hypothetical protein
MGGCAPSASSVAATGSSSIADRSRREVRRAAALRTSPPSDSISTCTTEERSAKRASSSSWAAVSSLSTATPSSVTLCDASPPRSPVTTSTSSSTTTGRRETARASPSKKRSSMIGPRTAGQSALASPPEACPDDLDARRREGDLNPRSLAGLPLSRRVHSARLCDPSRRPKGDRRAQACGGYVATTSSGNRAPFHPAPGQNPAQPDVGQRGSRTSRSRVSSAQVVAPDSATVSSKSASRQRSTWRTPSSPSTASPHT